MANPSATRTGGRNARRAKRAAALPDHLHPIRPGLEGGHYKPLSDADVLKIHNAALEALETIGLIDAPQSGIDYMTGAGAVLGDDGRLRFPRALVEDTLAKANRSVTLFARDPKYDLELSGTRAHYGTAGAAVHLVEADGQHYRLNSNCFVVPPMKFATESCEVMEACIKGGMPVLLLSAGMAGATAPSTVAGAIVQACAECLGGLVYVNAVKPSAPAVFGTWPFGLDLRTGAMSIGSGEQALLTAGCAQMHQFYGIPGGAAAGASDSKLPDMQAGWEQMNSNVMAGLAGLNMVYEAAGMHASLLGFCHESLILADDNIGQALRCARGIEVTDETLALDQIAEVCIDGPGHYLGTDQPLARMQSDFVYTDALHTMTVM